MSVNELVKSATARVDKIRVRGTAMNPMLWLVGLVSPLALVLSFFAIDPVLRYISFGLGALMAFLGVIAYFIWAFLDPDRLQSEKYLLQKSAQAMLYQSRGSAATLETADGVPRVEQGKLDLDDGDPR